jgi:hypothetical protein
MHKDMKGMRYQYWKELLNEFLPCDVDEHRKKAIYQILDTADVTVDSVGKYSLGAAQMWLFC